MQFYTVLSVLKPEQNAHDNMVCKGVALCMVKLIWLLV